MNVRHTVASEGQRERERASIAMRQNLKPEQFICIALALSEH